MLTLVPEEIEEYARAHSDPEPALLTELAAETHENTDLPQMLIGPLEGNLLRTLVQLTGGRRVLELGCFTGYSALWMASGMPADGRLTTCDVSEEYTAIARKFWARSEHGSKIELRLGPALETIETLEGPFDLVFVDADKVNYVNYWDACIPKIRSGGLLVADNVLWSGRVLDPVSESDRAIAEFNTHARDDDRVECAVLTVRDGMLVARKK